MRSTVCLATLTLLTTACHPSASVDAPEGLLTGTEAFVQIPKPQSEAVSATQAKLSRSTLASVAGSTDFYLAIRKDALAQRWFLSAYMKQFFPGDASALADITLGTRVVSFQLQNDKLFVFDVSNGHKASAVESPDILVEAYPVVRFLPFDLLPGSSQYVLVDLSQGLNRFGVTGQVFQDPVLAAFGAVPVTVGVAFMQNFRKISDGVTFEEVFTGQATPSSGIPESVWGTLGVSLRSYAVGAGYVATQDPGASFYFPSDRRILPDTGYQSTSNPVKWNLHPGMKPIPFYISAGARRAQADFPEVDVLGALKRGIESWNAVLGFKAFEAVQVNDDRVRDDDQSFLLVDYPGAGNPFAFADWRSNPNNGEIRGGSIYFGGEFFGALEQFEDDNPPPPGPGDRPRRRPTVRTVQWGGMPAQKLPCLYWSPGYRGLAHRLHSDRSRTAAEKGALFIQHVVLHEMGHVLGLRHNFKGSLVPPSSSAMDYLDDFTDAVELGTPGRYDIAAIRYLYNQSTALPTDPFCTDEDTAVDATCAIFDSGADPLRQWWAPFYSFIASLVIDSGLPVEFLDLAGLNEILAFARDTGFVAGADRTDALAIAFDRSAAPLASPDVADPFVASQANRVGDFVMRRTTLDPPEARGNIVAPISDPGVLQLLSTQAGLVVQNVDGARTLSARRAAVDVLKRLQVTPALIQLRAARQAIQAALSGGTIPTGDVPGTEDLLARIDAALAPYFD